MIQIEALTGDAERKVGQLILAAGDGGFDIPVEIAAWRVHRELVQETPKGWTGNTRREWKVEKVAPAMRRVYNNSKIMLFLEGGTGWAGTPTSNGGYIYPKTKKALFIPLTSTAAHMGWSKGMVWGKDYVLAKRVRGIKAMRIVAKMRPRAAQLLRDEMKLFLQRIIK